MNCNRYYYPRQEPYHHHRRAVVGSGGHVPYNNSPHLPPFRPTHWGPGNNRCSNNFPRFSNVPAGVPVACHIRPMYMTPPRPQSYQQISPPCGESWSNTSPPQGRYEGFQSPPNNEGVPVPRDGGGHSHFGPVPIEYVLRTSVAPSPEPENYSNYPTPKFYRRRGRYRAYDKGRRQNVSDFHSRDGPPGYSNHRTFTNIQPQPVYINQDAEGKGDEQTPPRPSYDANAINDESENVAVEPDSNNLKSLELNENGVGTSSRSDESSDDENEQENNDSVPLEEEYTPEHPEITCTSLNRFSPSVAKQQEIAQAYQSRVPTPPLEAHEQEDSAISPITTTSQGSENISVSLYSSFALTYTPERPKIADGSASPPFAHIQEQSLGILTSKVNKDFSMELFCNEDGFYEVSVAVCISRYPTGFGRAIDVAGYGIWFGDGNKRNFSGVLDQNRPQTLKPVMILASAIAIGAMKREGYSIIQLNVESDYLNKNVLGWISKYMEDAKAQPSNWDEFKYQPEIKSLCTAASGMIIKWAHLPTDSSRKAPKEFEKAKNLARNATDTWIKELRFRQEAVGTSHNAS